MSVVRRVLWWSLRIVLFPILLAVREAIRHAPKRMRDRLLGAAHEEADRLFYLGQFEELRQHCSGALKCFPDDAKLHSMYAIDRTPFIGPPRVRVRG